eukprot:CAMPEP_0168393322 /NCGR_PEP_ID=MMETSP0228-20121227/18958_1 /TAXON_ID=133427 /ORGANISM="Protoceratium reticulatum, Strain CCCM 535 (=CCMP 1889)" /LENGTH=58 /DNA_ID=CAMNT_0008406699 /DNA_START=103 /DNA_END=276 /DNA_ORIENTATION=+
MATALSVFLRFPLLASVLCVAHAKVEIKAMKHDIQGITAGNFDGVISKFRDSAVSSLW